MTMLPEKFLALRNRKSSSDDGGMQSALVVIAEIIKKIKRI